MPTPIRVCWAACACAFTLMLACGGSHAEPATTNGPEPTTGSATAAFTATDDCPGGMTTDGDCCVTGRACGASCIAANRECHVEEEHEEDRAAPTIEAVAVHTRSQIPTAPLAAGEFRVHLVDVGTGLAILIQGQAFTMLFDGGSGDDKRGITSTANNSRLLAYLWTAIGASGPPECAPTGEGTIAREQRPEVTIDHVVLSHPHEDHAVFLDELLHCYDVDHVWNVGVVNDAAFYRDFVEAVVAEPGVRYHTVTAPVPGGEVEIAGTTINYPSPFAWSQFAEGHVEQLGNEARFTVLFADAAEHHDFNQNSLVLRVDLGGASVLLAGDAESGPREPPSGAAAGSEAHLLATHAAELDVDVLQVGHHGSMTSSRRVFLDAVSPRWALIGAGPKSYSGVVLPDQPVVDALLEVLGGDDAATRLLRTDVTDGEACPDTDKVGTDDTRPGGCDNWTMIVRPGTP